MAEYELSVQVDDANFSFKQGDQTQVANTLRCNQPFSFLGTRKVPLLELWRGGEVIARGYLYDRATTHGGDCGVAWIPLVETLKELPPNRDYYHPGDFRPGDSLRFRRDPARTAVLGAAYIWGYLTN